MATTRLNVNVNEETADALKQLAQRRGTTVTEIIRRAVSVYKFIDDEVIEGGQTLKLVGKSGQETILTMI